MLKFVGLRFYDRIALSMTMWYRRTLLPKIMSVQWDLTYPSSQLQMFPCSTMPEEELGSHLP